MHQELENIENSGQIGSHSQTKPHIAEGATSETLRTTYDIRTAPQNYLSIATVLAGFAFTAAVLVIQIPSSDTLSSMSSVFRNLATIAFVISFLGCTLSAFTCSIVTGEMNITRRSYTVALLGGVGLVIPASFIFWGTIVLLRSYLDIEYASISSQVFAVFIALPPLYLSIFALGAQSYINVNRPNWMQIANILVPSYTPLLFVYLMKYIFNQSLAIRTGVLPEFVDTTDILVSLYQSTMPLAIILMIGNSIWMVFSAHKEPSYCLSPLATGMWLSIHSVIISFLLFVL